ncbi:MAG TPA: GWxTD domain-containing protein, partial [Bacteroidota bacterium]
MRPVRTIVFVLLSALCVDLVAQQAPSSSFVLNVDYARFRNDQTSGYLEIYYGFYPHLITLKEDAGKFSGAVILRMELINTATNAPIQQERSVLPVSLADTSSASSRSTIITQAGYVLPFGEYRLRVVATDSLAPARGDAIELPISVKDPGTVATFSDLELCSEIKSSEDKANAFYKNSLEVVPNSTLVYGVTANPVMFHYAELYNLDPAKQYSVKMQIVDALKKVVRESSKPRTFGVKNAVDVGTVNVTSLGSGKYHFVVTLVDEGGTEVSKVEKSFYVYNPHIQAPAVTPVALKASELAGLSGDELAAEFRKAQYVSTDEDKKTFTNITNAEGRREFLAKFWVQVEQGHVGKMPVSRMEYLRRVAAASAKYGNKSREGWTTDRGRIYVLYGDPDEIERNPSQNNAKPHEIWHFYQIENG